MPNKYGAAVIGDAAYEEAQEIVRTNKDKYGPGVTDHPGTDTALSPAERAKYPVQGEKIIPLAEDALEDLVDEGGDHYANLDEFRAALGDDPAKVTPLLQYELERDGGPRKGALQSLRKVEVEGQNRPDVLTLIDEQLG